LPQFGNTPQRNAMPLIVCARAGLFLLGVEPHSSPYNDTS
jgi:hypothetical protein